MTNLVTTFYEQDGTLLERVETEAPDTLTMEERFGLMFGMSNPEWLSEHDAKLSAWIDANVTGDRVVVATAVGGPESEGSSSIAEVNPQGVLMLTRGDEDNPNADERQCELIVRFRAVLNESASV